MTDKKLDTLLDGRDKIGRAEFTSMMADEKKKLPEKSQIIAAFECLDPHNDGFVSIQQLRKSLMMRGDEKYSKEEVDALVGIAGDVDGQIDYKQFVDFVISHSIDADDPFR